MHCIERVITMVKIFTRQLNRERLTAVLILHSMSLVLIKPHEKAYSGTPHDITSSASSSIVAVVDSGFEVVAVHSLMSLFIHINTIETHRKNQQ